MTTEMLVLEEGDRTFNSKTGTKHEYVISIRDSGQGERCTNNFTYAMNDEEKDRYKGKLRDTRVKVTIRKIMPQFSGDLRIEGKIEPVTTAK